MTGVEAVSNGVSAFREPKVRQAHGTLAAIVIILALLLLGIAHLARAYGLMAIDQTMRATKAYSRNWLARYTGAAGFIMSRSPAFCPSSVCQPTQALWIFPDFAISWPRTDFFRAPSPFLDDGSSIRLEFCF
jgi:hypothetical protein